MTRWSFIVLGLAVWYAACVGDETVATYGGSDKDWRVVEIDNVPFEANAALSFSKRGKIEGTGPCNTYTARMTTPYPWFETGPIMATQTTCPNLDAETVFFNALSEMTLSEVFGDTLILSTVDGRSIILVSDA